MSGDEEDFGGGWDDDGGETVEEGGPLAKAGNACCMLGLGILMLPMSLFLLGWNENNYVCTNAKILYGEENAVEVMNCDNTQVSNEFAVFSCPLLPSSLETYTPCSFNSGLMNCPSQLPVSFQSVSGRQTVEVCQCAEECTTSTHKNSAGQNVKKKTCNYQSKWSQTPIPASSFQDKNKAGQQCPGLANYANTGNGNAPPPTNLEMGVSEDFAQSAVVGASAATGFTLNKGLIEGLRPDIYVDLSNLTQAFHGPGPQVTTGAWQVSKANLHVSGHYLLSCAGSATASPCTLGCVRIAYQKSSATSPTVITRVASAGMTEPQATPGSWGCSSGHWQDIRPEKMQKADFMTSLHEANQTTTWLLRMVGCLLAWLSVYCCFQPIAAAFDIIGDYINCCPCGGYIEDFLEGVVTSIICLLSCGIGCSCALFVIAMVWLAMRPLYGGLMLGACVLLCCAVAGCRSMTTGRKQRDQRFADEE
jgi:hypothetical protein